MPRRLSPIKRAVTAALLLATAATAQGADAEREAELLEQLRGAETPGAAQLIERELDAIWSRSGSAAVDLLLRRGREALEAGDPGAAVEHLTAAIDFAPAFAEARAARAAAYYLTGYPGPALADLRAALALNPHHGEAMKGLAVMLEEMGDAGGALEVWRRVADMDPQDGDAEQSVGRLTLLVEGVTL